MYFPFSHSKVMSFYVCKRNFYYNYIAIGSKKPESNLLDIGLYVHEFIADYTDHLNIVGDTTDYDHADTLIKNISCRFIDANDRELFENICKNHIYRYIQDNKVFISEKRIAVDNTWDNIVPWDDPGAHFRGVIDLGVVEIDDVDEKLIPCVEDYKTGYSNIGIRDQLLRYVKPFRAYIRSGAMDHLIPEHARGYELSDSTFISVNNPRATHKDYHAEVFMDEVNESVKYTDMLIKEIEIEKDFHGKVCKNCETCQHINYCSTYSTDDEGLNIARKWINSKNEHSKMTRIIKSYVKEHGDISVNGGKIGDVKKDSFKYNGRNPIQFIIDYSLHEYRERNKGLPIEIPEEDMKKIIENEIYDKTSLSSTEFFKILKSLKIRLDKEEIQIIQDCLATKTERNSFEIYEGNEDDILQMMFDEVENEE